MNSFSDLPETYYQYVGHFYLFPYGWLAELGKAKACLSPFDRNR